MASAQQMVYKALLIVVILLVLSIGAGANLPNSEYIFQKLLESSQTVSFMGKRTFMSYGPGGSHVREESVIRKAPDKQRIEVLSPPEIAGFVVVISGRGKTGDVVVKEERRWHVREERGPGERRPSMFGMPGEMEESLIQNSRLLLQNYKVSVLDGGRIAGRKTYLLEVDPKFAGRPSRKVWTDVEKGVILKMEHYDPQKRLQWLFAYSEINFNPDIGEEIFRVQDTSKDKRRDQIRWKHEELWNYSQGGPDLNKIRKEAQLNVVIPDQISAGFVLQNIYNLGIKEWKNVHLKYNDGLTILSVFQSSSDRPDRGMPGPPPRQPGDAERREPRQEMPRPPPDKVEKVVIGGVECEVRSGGPMLIFRWNYGGVYSTLIGELSRSEMTKIVNVFVNASKRG